MRDPFAIGTQVIVWGRPEANLILLFGEGRYEGVNFINSQYWPVVRLTNGREITVHQAGIEVGRADIVAESCKKFAGDVIEWDLDDYLRGNKPSVEQRVKSGPSGSLTALPPPKTATDKVMFIKQEIEMQENKIKVAEKVIAEARAAIDAKKKEIGDMTQTVLTELSAMNPDLLKMIAAQVAEQMKTTAAPPVVAPEVPVTMVIAAPPVVTPVVARIVQPPSASEVDHHTTLATED